MRLNVSGCARFSCLALPFRLERKITFIAALLGWRW
jgi:hypothetical protein